MQDQFFHQLWNDDHERFSADLSRVFDRLALSVRRSGAMPRRILALAAAVTLSATSTLVAIGPIDAGAPQIAAALDRDGSPAMSVERA